MTVELEVVRENLAAARAAIGEAARRSGREPGAVELLAAIKYVAPEDMETLNARVYASLFLTPRSDPWLGLAPDVYSAIEGDGQR